MKPIFGGHLYGNPQAKHSVEIFLDFICPFSRKMYKRMVDEVLIKWNQAYPNDQFKFIFYHQVQPWHPQSTLLHEVSLIPEVSGYADHFKIVADALFNVSMEEYNDQKVYNETREQTYKRLIDSVLVTTLTGHIQKQNLNEFFYSFVKLNESGPNDGNLITNHLKYHLKLSRQLSVHVSPSVYIDGLYDSTIQSSFTYEQWEELLKERFEVKN